MPVKRAKPESTVEASLIWRGSLAPTESIAGVVMRLLVYNWCTPAEIVEVLKPREANGSWNLNRSEGFLSRRLEGLLRIPRVSASKLFTDFYLLPDIEPSETLIVCSKCLERGFHSVLFQLPFVHVCPVDGIKLKDTCTRYNLRDVARAYRIPTRQSSMTHKEVPNLKPPNIESADWGPAVSLCKWIRKQKSSKELWLFDPFGCDDQWIFGYFYPNQLHQDDWRNPGSPLPWAAWAIIGRQPRATSIFTTETDDYTAVEVGRRQGIRTQRRRVEHRLESEIASLAEVTVAWKSFARALRKRFLRAHRRCLRVEQARKKAIKPGPSGCAWASAYAIWMHYWTIERRRIEPNTVLEEVYRNLADLSQSVSREGAEVSLTWLVHQHCAETFAVIATEACRTNGEPSLAGQDILNSMVGMGWPQVAVIVDAHQQPVIRYMLRNAGSRTILGYRCTLQTDPNAGCCAA